MKRILCILAALCFATAAHAQTSPNWSYGYVPTAGEWNFWFGSKQNTLNYVPLNSAGGPMSGRLITAASTSSIAGFNIQPGVTPSPPLNGDMWVTSAGLFVQVNGLTVGPLATSSAPTMTGPVLVTNNATPILAQLAGTVVQAAGLDAAIARYELNAFGGPAYFTAVRRDNTNASPQALAANDEIGGTAAFGFNGTSNVGPSAVFRFFASETWSIGHQGSYARISTTPTASTTLTDVAGFENNGGVTIPPSVTGGSQGAGTINISGGYYQNGILLPTQVNVTPQGRLTLTSVTPVLTSTVSAAGTVFFTPYQGNLEPLWNGTSFVNTQCAEISNILANSSTGNAGPAAAVASSAYDLFVWNNSGTCTFTRGPVWTNTTTRSAGTALARVNGILVNSVAITNGPGANAGTYVGTIATDGGGATVTFNPGSSAAGGGAAVIGLWNMYNRVSVKPLVLDSNASHTYTTAAARAFDNSNTARITFVRGQDEDGAPATQIGQAQLAAAGGSLTIGIGLDSTSAISANSTPGIDAAGSTTAITQIVSSWSGFPGLGSHFLQALETGDGVNANTVFTFAGTNRWSLTADLRY